jgi:hypothetical protein
MKITLKQLTNIITETLIQENKKEVFTSVDAQINKYLDDLLDGDFDLTKFMQGLVSLSQRSSNIIELKKTILKMGIEKLPAKYKTQALQKLKSQFGVSASESEYDLKASDKAPNAGAAGPIA